MITMVELAMLRAADQGATLPGVDTPTGNLLAPATLIQLPQISTLWNAPFLYNAATNIVYVKQNGAVLNGINFGTATVEIVANNVTIENCTFAGTTNYMSLQQQAGYAGAVVRNCTFTTNGQTNPILGAYIISPGQIGSVSNVTVTGNYLIGGASVIDAGNAVTKG